MIFEWLLNHLNSADPETGPIFFIKINKCMLHLHSLPYMVSAHLWFNLKAWSLYHIIMYTITFGFMIHKAVKLSLELYTSHTQIFT